MCKKRTKERTLFDKLSLFLAVLSLLVSILKLLSLVMAARAKKKGI